MQQRASQGTVMEQAQGMVLELAPVLDMRRSRRVRAQS